MNKRIIRRALIISLLSLAGFFVLVTTVNQQIVHQQARDLRRVGRTYAASSHDGVNRQALAESEAAFITVIPNNPRTTRQKVMADALRGNRDAAFVTTVNVNGRTEQAYLFQNKGQWVAVSRFKSSVWTTAPEQFWLLTLAFAALLAAILIWLFRSEHRYQEAIEVMSHNLDRIRRKKDPDPVILPPDSPFVPVARRINALAAEQAHLREKVAVRQSSFDRLIDNLPLGVMLIDTDKDVILHNHAMSQLLGHQIPQPRHSYLDDVKTYALARMIEHTFRHEKTHHQELTILTTQKSVDASVIPLNQGISRLQVLVILYDVTYLRQVEKMQLDFVGNVSHELKTPVTAISGFAETLLGGAKNDPATLDRFLGIIYDESKRLTQLINDILTLSRPDSNQNVAASVALKKLVDDALHNLAKVIQDKQIRVQVAITPDLLVVTDERKLTQIVRNLLNNAVFYNRLAGHVTISAQVVDHQLSLAVADTGIGISETEQARIFERFYRVDKARSRHNGGTGLGLAIVAELVKSMDGHVAVHSQVGVGSTFTVTLPVGEGPHRG